MRNLLFPLVFFVILTSFFFYKTIFYGFVPIPGDALVGEFEPYRSYSFLGYAPGAVPHKAQGPDVIRMLYPWKIFAIDQLFSGELPLWNPYSFSGKPHIAHLQAGVFYPLNVLFFLGSSIGWSLYIVLQPILAACFTYLFLREIRLGKVASLFGGVVFSFCGFMVVWLEYGNLIHSFLWLPLVLWGIHRYLRMPNFWNWFVVVISFLLSFLAGYAQFTFYMYLFASLFLLYCYFTEKQKPFVKKRYGILLLGFITSIFLGALQLFPMLELIIQSARTSYTAEQLSKNLIPVQSVFGIFFPDIFGNPASRNYWTGGTYIERVLYIGSIPFLFVLFTYFTRTSKFVKFFSLIAFFSLLSTIDVFPTKFFHSIGIPFLSTTIPSRILGMYSFSVAVLAAIGFDYWIKHSHSNKIFTKIPFLISFFSIIVLLFISVFLVGGIFPEFKDKLLIAQRNMILPLFFLVSGSSLLFFAKIIPKFFVITLFFLLTIFDLLYFFQKITPFSPKEFIYPQTPVFKKLKEIQGIDRSWGYGSAYIDNNLYTQEKLFTTDGYDPLFIRRYGEFIATSKDGAIPTTIPRSDVFVALGFGGKDLEENIYRKRILDIAGVKYILNKKDHAFPRDQYNLLWEDGVFEIYENTNAIPRVFLVDSYVIESNKKAIIKRLFDKEFDPKATVVLEEKPTLAIQSNSSIRNANLRLYSPNKTIVETESDANTLLFFSDNYFPGWKVSIDGKDATIYRANYTFRAVPVEKGVHTVIFSYQPFSFKLGVYISIVTAIFTLLFFLITKKYEVFKNT